MLIEGQTGFMGLVALVAAIPAGLLTAVLLPPSPPSDSKVTSLRV